MFTYSKQKELDTLISRKIELEKIKLEPLAGDNLELKLNLEERIKDIAKLIESHQIVKSNEFRIFEDKEENLKAYQAKLDNYKLLKEYNEHIKKALEIAEANRHTKGGRFRFDEATGFYNGDVRAGLRQALRASDSMLAHIAQL